MNYYVIVFKNTHDAMAGERILQNLGFDFRIMPTPTTITQSCGICIRFEDEDSINKLIENNYIQYKNIYNKTCEGFSQIK